MKKMKKLAAMLIAVVMAISLAVPAMAAADGEITILKSESGVEYSVYQVFTLESYNKTAGAYHYKIANNSWKDFFSTGSGKDYAEIATDGTVIWKKDKTAETDAAAFAKLALAYATEKNIAATKAVTATNKEFKITGLDHGYYVVKSSRGTNAGVVTATNETVTPIDTEMSVISEKNGLPNISKVVDKGTAKIGETVTFTVTVNAASGAVNYVIHDTMEADKWTTPNILSVTLQKSEESTVTTLVPATDYELVTTSLSDTCTFEIALKDTICNQLNDNDKIVVTYTAKLTEKADISGNGNTNTAELYHGSGSTAEVETCQNTVTYTYLVNAKKEDENNAPLANAVFELHQNNQALTFVDKGSDTSGRDLYYICADPTSCAHTTGHLTTITTNDTGMFAFIGLSNGTYTLVETKAPSGYIKTNTPATVTIDNENSSEVKIVNTAGTALPETGGMGTTLFYIAGSILMLGAAVLLITKKRTKAE